MSILISSSTVAQIEALYADNASYAEDNSVAMCWAFITVCRLLVLKCPRSTGTPQAGLTTAIDLVQKEKAAAGKWPEGHDTCPTSTSFGPRVTRVSFENGR